MHSQPLPAPHQIIDRFHNLDNQDNKKSALDFFYCHENPIEDTSLNDNTITAHDAKIAGVDEIGTKNAGVDQLGNEHQNYEISGVEYYDNREISRVDENTAALAVDIPLNEIPGVYSKNSQEESFQDTNPNATNPPLPPDPPPAEAVTTLPKLEQDTTPHINTEEVVTKDNTDDDDTEYTPPHRKHTQ